MGVDVDERGIVTGGAPIIMRFIGQPYENLKRWVSDFPPVIDEAMEESESVN
ncbi:MAG: hypothetical protein MN733_10505 [Nitrososphaera sp.]|nr:hypothetical protein [Nitrososphaera sp.]